MSAVPFVQIIIDGNRMETPCVALQKTDTCDLVQRVVQMLCPARKMLAGPCVQSLNQPQTRTVWHRLSCGLRPYRTFSQRYELKVLDKVVAALARGLVLIVPRVSCKPGNEGVGLKI